PAQLWLNRADQLLCDPNFICRTLNKNSVNVVPKIRSGLSGPRSPVLSQAEQPKKRTAVAMAARIATPLLRKVNLEYTSTRALPATQTTNPASFTRPRKLAKKTAMALKGIAHLSDRLNQEIPANNEIGKRT